MDDSTRESLIQLVAAWLPLVVFLGLILAMMRKGNAYYRKYDETVAGFMKSNAELTAINRVMAQTLVEIRNLLQTGKS